MKLLTKIFLILLAAGVSHAQDCKVQLNVETNLQSSGIYLNNELIGKGSIRQEINKGPYFLKVIGDLQEWDSEAFADSFFVNDCNDDKNFKYDFKNKIYLQTEPPDSYVFDDDSLIGHTPLFITGNFKNLTLKKPGFKDEIISADKISGDKIIPLEYIGRNIEPIFIKKNIFKVLAASAVVLGGLTAYFKLKADDRFENYEFTGSQTALDDTRKYDLISGITFGALQINFGILIYYFLTD